MMKKTGIYILSVLMVTVSCNKDNPIPEIPNEQAVEISIFHDSDTRATRGFVPEENTVETLDLLIFKNDKFLYWRSAYKVNNKFRAILTIDNGLDVHFLANVRQLITDFHDQGQLAVDMSWEAMQLKLVDTNPSALNYTNSSQIKLPMWGMLRNKDVNDVPVNHWGTVNLLRSVASVDVEVSAQIPDARFTLKDVRLYFVPDRGFLSPAISNYAETQLAVLAAASPLNMQTTLTLLSDQYDVTTKSIANKLYLYDNDTDENNRTILPNTTRRHTRVVVGAVYEGTKYYYPIDFETENDALDQVTRNWKYIFQINSATSRGYTDPDEASREPATGLNVSIVQWKEKPEGDFYLSGPYYVGITWDPYWEREVFLERPTGSTRQVGLRSNIKADLIQLEFAPGSANGPTRNIAQGIMNDRFSVEKISDSDGYITGLLFTALKEYDTTDLNSNHDSLIVTSGRIQFVIPVTQLNKSSNDWEDGGNKDIELI